jgi:DNA invertase Pin-like site-specific DNA recombinase
MSSAGAIMLEYQKKVSADHLKRGAYLYIRQSTLKQVVENTESTQRQYALRERAIALGWPLERITIIDSDLGQSGAQAADREGFQKLVAEVGLGNAGIVMGLEVSRLARNSTDWHRLLEICALGNTLILDEDGVYNPTHFNDRLLLGLKGTMSEAELHVLHARLRGGILNKAKRGELKTSIPLGFVYSSENRIVLNPDKQVQESIRMFFKTFQESGSAWNTVKFFHNRGLLFPREQKVGLGKGEIFWGPLTRSQALHILKNPKYAGVYFYGRARYSKLPNGKHASKRLSREQWHTFLPNSHEAYISLEEFERNQKKLLENSKAYGEEREKRPPREGPALLQGIVVCGKCGRRMTIKYHTRTAGDLHPTYVCQGVANDHSERSCQKIPGTSIDKAISELLLESMTPLALEVALNVQANLHTRLEEANLLRKKHVERAQYEAELARHRYMQVDPRNRLVADNLEADWNIKLHAVAEAQEEYERQRKVDKQVLTAEQKEQILSLVADFPKLWNDSKTPDREKKRMARLILEDVTLIRDEKISVNVRFKGGATKTLTLPLPLSAFMERKTRPEIVEEVDRLLEGCYDSQIAEILNSRGFQTGDKLPFTTNAVRRIRYVYQLKDRYERLRGKGYLSRIEMIKYLNTCDSLLRDWKNQGWIRTHAYGHGRYNILYEPPGDDFYAKISNINQQIYRNQAVEYNLSQEV